MNKYVSVIVGLALCFLTAYSQDLQVSGTVSSNDDGTALPGVTVQIKGTTTGVITDIDGNYTINVQSDDTLVIASLGMVEQERVVGGQTTIDVVLETEIAGLDEVIVVGYGTVSRSSFVGAASVVKAADIASKSTSSFDKSLQGLAPGLLSSTNSGTPGSGTDVIIRGIGSINASTDPLYIIDGVPITTGDLYTYRFNTSNPLASIEPSDIESITVLKDASSTSIYGARASNGVIVITTKRGKSGKTKFEFNTQLGSSQRVSNNFEGLNAAEYKELVYEQYINAGISPYVAYARISEMGDNDVNWDDEIFRKGFNQKYNLKASGGDEKTRFYISGNYLKQDGIIIASDMERYSTRVNIDHKANDMIKLGMNSSVSYTKMSSSSEEGAFSNPISTVFFSPPVSPVRNNDGTYYHISELGNVNGVEAADLNSYTSDQKRYHGNFYTEIAPLKGLTYKLNAGADYFFMSEETYLNPTTAEGESYKGYSEYASTERLNRIVTNTLSYTKTFGGHEVDVLVGQEAQKTSEFTTRLAAANFPSERFVTLVSGSNPQLASTAKEGTALASFFSRINYSFNKKYNLGLSARRDGSPRFGVNNRWGNFGSVGVSWRITEESFMGGVSFINDMKLRASYGTSGNQEILSYYDERAFNDYYTALGLYAYGADYNGQPGSYLYQLPNPDLRWERNQTTNIGLDFVTLGSRLNGTLELYQKNTNDLLLWVPISTVAGATGVMDNVAAMQNRGIELDVNGTLIDRTFKWTMGINFSANRNKVTALNNDEPINDDDNRQRAEIGHPYRSYYLVRWAGVNPADGSAMWLDAEGRPVMDYADAEKVLLEQKADPDFYGSVRSSLTYKAFTLSVQFYGVYGNSIYNNSDRYLSSDGGNTFNNDRHQLDRWRQPGDITSVPLRVDGNASSNKNSTRHLEDGSYLRLKNATLAYTMPEQLAQKIRCEGMRIYLMAENAYTWTNFSGWDPESALDGKSWFKYPNAQTYSIGLDLTF